jgi:hypothetical protein
MTAANATPRQKRQTKFIVFDFKLQRASGAAVGASAASRARSRNGQVSGGQRNRCATLSVNGPQAKVQASSAVVIEGVFFAVGKVLSAWAT